MTHYGESQEKLLKIRKVLVKSKTTTNKQEDLLAKIIDDLDAVINTLDELILEN